MPPPPQPDVLTKAYSELSQQVCECTNCECKKTQSDSRLATLCAHGEGRGREANSSELIAAHIFLCRWCVVRFILDGILVWPLHGIAIANIVCGMTNTRWGRVRVRILHSSRAKVWQSCEQCITKVVEGCLTSGRNLWSARISCKGRLLVHSTQ